MTKKILMGLIALVLIAVMIGNVGAINPDYPIKMVVLGEIIPYDSAYNLDPYNIVPKDTFLICKIDGDPKYSTCIARDSNDPDGSKFRYFGAWRSQSPAPFGEYYAVPYSSPYVINNKTVDDRIKTDPAFRTTHLKLYTVLPKPVPTTIPPPLPTTTIPTPTPTPTPDYAAMEAKIKAQETEIQNIKATLAQTPIPTPAITPSPSASIQTFGDVISPTPTPTPRVTVNYTKHLQEMETRIAAQDVKIEEQASWIDQILRFLGLKN